ncbi:MAG: hypothetical protein A3J28_13155 [Acidobacteria bacterium RIFCSPLOWO2_12_FULL_60_22]|nr:MAG: hypothetical protein A3J28_13155 [Acidobacteria bacterium RIFCSPLOWO2_12_FULL_60_22]
MQWRGRLFWNRQELCSLGELPLFNSRRGSTCKRTILILSHCFLIRKPSSSRMILGVRNPAPGWSRQLLLPFQPMVAVGIFLFFLTASLIVFRFCSAERLHPFPREGYAGALLLVVAEILMLARVEPVTTYFTPIAWTGYIFLVDSAAFSLRGKSLWRTARTEFVCLALCSIPLWLIFEAYNLRLANWVYVGLPNNWVARQFGYAWSFATIWPAIFETATLIRALGCNPGDNDSGQISAASGSRSASFIVLLGAFLLIVPLLVPPGIGSYLFGPVWLGFIFLLEPINHRLGSQSLWRDFQRGDYSRLTSLLAAGWVCGILWEFWNYWAQARWVYTFPILQEWKIFAMPLPGYLGFPAFAVECFVLFSFLTLMLNAIFRKLGKGSRPHGEALRL